MSRLIIGKDLSETSKAPFLYAEKLCRKYIEDTLESDILRNTLPARILIPGKIADGLLNRLPVIWVESTRIEAPEKNENQERFILDIYDEWIKQLLKRKDIKNPTISIFFEDPQKAEAWKRVEKPSWLNKSIFPLDRPMEEQISQKLGAVNIWRHISLEEVEDNTNGNFPFYYEHTSYYYPFFSFLYSISPADNSFLAQYIIRQIVESALIRILVIDDRVARTLWNRKDDRIKELNHMRISIAKKIQIDKKEIPLVKEADKDSRGLIDIQWQQDGTIIDVAANGGNSSDFDILFIHQTIFDDKLSEYIGQTNEDWKEQWIFNTKKTIPYIIFHSGRGKQKEKLPQNVQFIEYSALQQYILQEPSKFFLTLLALSTRGES